MTDNTDERLTKVLTDALLESDDVATLNAVRAARRIVEGHGGDAHRLVVSLCEDGPSPSNTFTEMNAQDYPPAMPDDDGLPREAAASSIHPPPLAPTE
jgi:hypothetical protein